MNYPNILTVNTVLRSARACMRQTAGGYWVPCRGEGFMSWRNRWRAAWLVFTGRADALVWEQQ